MAIREEVSGIGSMSKRTDLNVSEQPIRYISGLPYGEGQATYNQQASAPMAGVAAVEPLPVTALTAPTERPAEAITTGVDVGLGAGSEVLPPMPTRPTVSLADTFRQLADFDQSGDSELIYRQLVDKGY